MKSIISILFSLSSLLSFAQPAWQWANEVTTNANESVLGSFTDKASGETYICGHFEGNLSNVYTVGLNGTPNMSTPLGVRDAFVAKYDAVGNVIWAFKIGGAAATTEAAAITIGPSGNIYVTGRFQDGTIDFKGVSASTSNTQIPTGVSNDVFVAAYNSNGELLWVNRSTDQGFSRSYGITTGPNGIYVAGLFRGDITFPPLSPIMHSGSIHSDAFITKYDFSGNAVRVKLVYSAAGDGDVKAFNVAVHGSNVFAVGASESTTWTFGPTGLSPTANNNGVAGINDIWVISFKENNFNLNWEQAIGGSRNDLARGVVADDNGVYLTGAVAGTSINFPGIAPLAATGFRSKIFTCKLFNTTGPTAGETDWAIIEQKNTSAISSYGSSIALDAVGNLFIAGTFSETTNFNGGLNSKTSAGGKDIFVMNRKVDGSFVWVETAESTGNDEGFGVGYDNNGNVYVGGIYEVTSTFGSTNLSAGFLNNGFVARLSLCELSIACPSNETIKLNASCQYALLDYTTLAVTSASCGILSTTQFPEPGTLVGLGTNSVNVYLTDSLGNIDSCTFTISVIDTVNPIIICPTNINITSDVGLNTAIVNGIPPLSVTDNCAIDNVSYILTGVTLGSGLSDASGATFNVGNTIVTYSATDASGNVTNCSFTVNVAGSKALTIASPLFEIPNGFSPNEDGDNDFFVIKGLELQENEVTIFNRWGIELFKTVNYQNDWGGKSKVGNDLPEDTYFYTIKILNLNKELSGFILLKR